MDAPCADLRSFPEPTDAQPSVAHRIFVRYCPRASEPATSDTCRLALGAATTMAQ